MSRALAVIREEMVFAAVPERRRDRITQAIYAEQASYAPGGHYFQRGLFDWELKLVRSARFPRQGRVLVGGAGGGREAAALHDLGYEVLALEPNERLVALGQAALEGRPRLTLVRGSYADLIGATRREPDSGTGAHLAAALWRAPFDAVILGWTSFSYLAGDAEREALLRALLTLAPGAPVVLSFLSRQAEEPPSSATLRLRLRLRRWAPRMGARWSRRPGERFLPLGGFAFGLELAEVEQLARLAGYDVAHLSRDPEPHALLVPAPRPADQHRPRPSASVR